MTVYVIADIWVPAYTASVRDIVHKHGLARSGNVKTLEGKPAPQKTNSYNLLKRWTPNDFLRRHHGINNALSRRSRGRKECAETPWPPPCRWITRGRFRSLCTHLALRTDE
jgi:hypothetical protein